MNLTMDANTLNAIAVIVGVPCVAFVAWAFFKYVLSE